MVRLALSSAWRRPHSRSSVERSAIGPARQSVALGQGAVVWGMLFVRSFLAIGLQTTFAAVALLAGASDPWRVASDWWLGWFAIANVATLVLLQRAVHRDGHRLRDLYRVRRHSVRGDLPWVIVALVVAGPIGFLPNILLGQALWGNAQVGADLSFRALPVAAAVAILVTFPIVQAAAELPTYFGYVLPRLQSLYGWRARALIVTALTLSTQHIFLPLLLDWRFLVWRALMFIPFAFWIGFVLQRRPTALPYLAIAHGLLDASLPVLVLIASL